MTLIEILIVVILIGMTAAFVAPTIDVTSCRVNGAMQMSPSSRTSRTM